MTDWLTRFLSAVFHFTLASCDWKCVFLMRCTKWLELMGWWSVWRRGWGTPRWGTTYCSCSHFIQNLGYDFSPFLIPWLDHVTQSFQVIDTMISIHFWTPVFLHYHHPFPPTISELEQLQFTWQCGVVYNPKAEKDSPQHQTHLFFIYNSCIHSSTGFS